MKSIRNLSILNEYICLYIRNWGILRLQLWDTVECRGQALFHIRAIIEHLGECGHIIHDQDVALTYTQECWAHCRTQTIAIEWLASRYKLTYLRKCLSRTKYVLEQQLHRQKKGFHK